MAGQTLRKVKKVNIYLHLPSVHPLLGSCPSQVQRTLTDTLLSQHEDVPLSTNFALYEGDIVGPGRLSPRNSQSVGLTYQPLHIYTCRLRILAANSCEHFRLCFIPFIQLTCTKCPLCTRHWTWGGGGHRSESWKFLLSGRRCVATIIL